MTRLFLGPDRALFEKGLRPLWIDGRLWDRGPDRALFEKGLRHIGFLLHVLFQMRPDRALFEKGLRRQLCANVSKL